MQLFSPRHLHADPADAPASHAMPSTRLMPLSTDRPAVPGWRTPHWHQSSLLPHLCHTWQQAGALASEFRSPTALPWRQAGDDALELDVGDLADDDPWEDD